MKLMMMYLLTNLQNYKRMGIAVHPNSALRVTDATDAQWLSTDLQDAAVEEPQQEAVRLADEKDRETLSTCDIDQLWKEAVGGSCGREL